MLTLILAASTFTFRGGSSAELTQAIADATQQPAVVAYMGEARVRAAEFPFEDAAKFKENARSYFAFQKSDGDALGFGTRTMPEWLLDPTVPANVPQGGSLTVTDGKISATPVKGKYLTGNAVERLSLSKPLRIHWLLKEVPVTIAANSADEKGFLSAVAVALAGKLTDQAQYAIDPDPKQLKERIVGGYRALESKANSRTQAAMDALEADLVSGLKDAEFTTAFATPSSMLSISAASGSTLYNSAWTYARTYVAEQPSPDRQIARARSLVDTRQPVQVTFRPRQGVTLAFLGQDGRVLVRLPEARIMPAMIGG